jgi:uncharacterized protein (TIGR02118 family)
MVKISVMYPYRPGARFDHAYYRDKHLPMIQRLMGTSLVRYSIDRGVSADANGTAPLFVAFQAGFGPHAAEIRSDITNYTDITPQRQVSEVVVEAGLS